MLHDDESSDSSKNLPRTLLMSNNNPLHRRPHLHQTMITHQYKCFHNGYITTSNILSSLPEETVEKTGDYKRVFVKGIITSWATYLIPKEWVADKSLALPQAQQQARVLDYSMTSSSSSGDNVLPDAAYAWTTKHEECKW